MAVEYEVEKNKCELAGRLEILPTAVPPPPPSLVTVSPHSAIYQRVGVGVGDGGGGGVVVLHLLPPIIDYSLSPACRCCCCCCTHSPFIYCANPLPLSLAFTTQVPDGFFMSTSQKAFLFLILSRHSFMYVSQYAVVFKACVLVANGHFTLFIE